MSGIRGDNTKPELIIRRLLHHEGFRYRLHVRSLPAKPDIVFPRYRAVIQINGCFWHGHNCHLFKWPSTRPAFWKKKITGNRDRDKRNRRALKRLGWRVLTIWECALKGKRRLPPQLLTKQIANWLTIDQGSAEIRGSGET